MLFCGRIHVQQPVYRLFFGSAFRSVIELQELGELLLLHNNAVPFVRFNFVEVEPPQENSIRFLRTFGRETAVTICNNF